jgi:hypothetical protein
MNIVLNDWRRLWIVVAGLLCGGLTAILLA